jgi:hypothetical protein
MSCALPLVLEFDLAGVLLVVVDAVAVWGADCRDLGGIVARQDEDGELAKERVDGICGEVDVVMEMGCWLKQEATSSRWWPVLLTGV